MLDRKTNFRNATDQPIEPWKKYVIAIYNIDEMFIQLWRENLVSFIKQNTAFLKQSIISYHSMKNVDAILMHPFYIS